MDDRRITEVVARVLPKQADYPSLRLRDDVTESAVAGQTSPFIGGAARCAATRSERNSVVTSSRFQ